MARHVLVSSSIAVLLLAALGCSSDTPSSMEPGPQVNAPNQMSPATGSNKGPTGPSTANPPEPGGSATPMQPPAGGVMHPTTVPGMTGTAGSAAPIAGAAAPIAGAGAPMMPQTPRQGETCLLPGSGSYGEPGPYKVGKMDIDLGMIQPTQNSGKFTVFYPQPLEASCKHPIVAWGNGTTVMGADVYAFFNENAASWGMVVAASWEDNAGSGAFHKAGLDWLLKQNEDASSMFHGKLSTRAGVSGHSQGAFGASAGSSHPNVEATVAVGGTATSSAKVAVLTLTGTEDIVMNPAALAERAAGKAFVASWQGGDHFGTQTLAGYIARDKGTMQMQRLYAAWFRCFLGDDSKACALFEGGTPDGCGICKDTGWAVLASKNM
jgi:hypothetical protein